MSEFLLKVSESEFNSNDPNVKTWQDVNPKDIHTVFLKGVKYSKVKYGHWDKLYGANYKCSACGAWYQTKDDYGNPEDKMPEYNYCPNCGALMVDEVEK